jgi:hypothetical protein
MSPCTVRQATPDELAAVDKLPKSKKPIYYDRSPVFRRRDKGQHKIAGSGWQFR